MPSRRRLPRLVIAAALVLSLPVALGLAYRALRFPPETTPEGAYLRIARNVAAGDLRVCFSYLEDEAQHAAYTVRDYRREAFDLVAATFPEPERGRFLERHRAAAEAPDGAHVWVDLARERGWRDRLRRDLSGIRAVERADARATVTTVRGTRYPFRRRQNGMWGLSLFTAELVEEAERAARDLDVVREASEDYRRAGRP